ncbi:inverse autotransporter beta domain-containing protein [Xenorhabdus eapokensis]|uniref:Putative invasin n=1 Tax=Xenorhabdus eapokensis TaxID=1873482 RepID=A0A1Q5TT93_9GAMM|nr:inverse autotransporter beta domain-containing protein [Xenorhabdus eapokensis]OKP03456.1 putative invasin [Xenorhabdus eapokensis]
MGFYNRNKSIKWFFYIGSLFLPFISMNSLAIGERNTEQQAVANTNNLNERGDETAGLIAQNIQTVSQVLSSSPSQLTEQAKAYALGKINGTISNETQRWLSQFGTARINFALDRKGKLDNGSLDLLLPFYDNKADWLVFSQFGYRHKDSRHTVNVGLGGRYFTPSWMYGLNTFFDHDVTGKNQRLGVGAEAWTDYVKLSANSYWRLTNWRQSLKERDWEERPANGFDLHGEFYLPAYPNLGGKLGFEQYFGDNVVLFNRDSKQKNPSLGRVGLNYTPIPLVTMGVDYKYGGSGHSETLFQANLNYRFGIPIGDQFSPASVASMRTLAGSRYDLVERNNHIVLDYRKKSQELQLMLPENVIVGYSLQKWPTPIQVAANEKSRVKRIMWQSDEAFKKNGGSISNVGGGNDLIALVLPQYVPDGQNTHTINVIAEENNGKLTKPALLNVTVQPFTVKQFKAEKLATTANSDKGGYNLLATLAHGTNDSDLIRNTLFNDVIWSIEPQDKNVTLHWDKQSKTNDQGQLQATVTSSQPLKDVKVFLEMPGMPKKHIGTIGFSGLLSDFSVKSVKPLVKGSVLAGDNGYTFTATVKDKAGNPLQNYQVDTIWYPEKLPDGMKWTSVQDTTDAEGRLFATLTSTNPAKGIKVGASIDGGKTTTYAENPVAFIDDIEIEGIEVTPTDDLEGDGRKAYLYKAKVTDAASNPIPHLTLGHDKVIWGVGKNGQYDHSKLLEEGKLVFRNQKLTTDEQGYLTANLTSSIGLDKIKAKLQVVTKNSKPEAVANTLVNFKSVDQPAGFHIYNSHNQSVYRYFKSNENGPHNLFTSVFGELRIDPNKPLVDPAIETGLYGIDSGQSGNFRYSDAFGGNKGVFHFREDEDNANKLPLLPIKLRAKVTNNQTGEIHSYTYTIKPLRIFSSKMIAGPDLTVQDNSCEKYSSNPSGVDQVVRWGLSSVNIMNLWPVSGEDIDNDPIYTEKYGTTLLEEFDNIMDWDLINKNVSGDRNVVLVYNNTRIKLNGFNPGSFMGFDINKRQAVPMKDVGSIICLITR